jgi:hypothetical protein
VGRLATRHGRHQAPGTDAGRRAPYSHSIVNEHSNQFGCNGLASASQFHTDTLAFGPPGTSVGEGFRSIRRSETFRDRSTSIDVWCVQSRRTAMIREIGCEIFPAQTDGEFDPD